MAFVGVNPPTRGRHLLGKEPFSSTFNADIYSTSKSSILFLTKKNGHLRLTLRHFDGEGPTHGVLPDD